MVWTALARLVCETQMEDQWTYQPLVSSRDPAFDEFFAIYVESIPLRERKTRAQISEIVTRPDYRVLLIKKKNTMILGFSMLFTPAQESFCLLEYMAVHPAYRNLGLGGQLFLRTFEDFVFHDGTVYGVLEIDSEREPSPDQDIRRRRQRFYRRLGCLRIAELSYVLPLSAEDSPPQMDLMVYFPDGVSFLRKAQLRHWLEVIYNKVYNCSPNDPRIVRMMEPVNDPVKLV